MQDFDPNRRTALKALGLGLLASAGPGVAIGKDVMAHKDKIDVSDVYVAHLESQADVETDAWGLAVFHHRSGEIVFTLAVSRLENTVMAHIHEDEALGPVAVWLHDFTTQAEHLIEGSFTGALNAGVITDDAISEGRAPEATSTTVAELIGKIDAGEAFVNVHTEANPGGEISGRIEPFEWSDVPLRM
ncbi:CHRD domain-containing protein [Saliphagus infecundisoli]|uniref:CHRD domain-containing protein n=1 Tax=Saliphagus infecundisoli TaxID=1849069 RepID=A0ABD5QMS6_9EURY|nr:CHRD domain-containing protein [Saliphagus infecundisoli]